MKLCAYELRHVQTLNPDAADGVCYAVCTSLHAIHIEQPKWNTRKEMFSLPEGL